MKLHYVLNFMPEHKPEVINAIKSHRHTDYRLIII